MIKSKLYHRSVEEPFNRSSTILCSCARSLQAGSLICRPMQIVSRGSPLVVRICRCSTKAYGDYVMWWRALSRGFTGGIAVNCLQPLVAAIHDQRPNLGTKSDKLHHDNAKSNVTKVVKKYLKDAGVGIIRHPPYIPDLAPCDHQLFDLIKRHLTDAVDEKDIESQITEALENFPKNEYLKTCNKWLGRMQLCINNKGDYFEHLKKNSFTCSSTLFFV